jgi:1-acyl-sn-glycerol-3-phosphate acyltransferase
MKKLIYKFIFLRLMGWRIVGEIDKKLEKCVFIVIPHTSWFDFFIGIFTRGIIEVELNWLGKKELFGFPLGWYFRYMGGAPLDRKGGLNLVDSIAQVFESRKIFRLGLSPEGTRKKVTELKTGFYYIAEKAKVPIIPVAFNYGKKEVNFGSSFYTTGDIVADLKIVLPHFKDVVGKIPENSYVV